MSNKQFAKRFLKLQRDVFAGERRKQKALVELRRVVGNAFAMAVEALAITPRVGCVRCGRDFMVDSIGESGMCADCSDASHAAGAR